jgi:hypothetical protein
MKRNDGGGAGKKVYILFVCLAIAYDTIPPLFLALIGRFCKLLRFSLFLVEMLLTIVLDNFAHING